MRGLGGWLVPSHADMFTLGNDDSDVQLDANNHDLDDRADHLDTIFDAVGDVSKSADDRTRSHLRGVVSWFAWPSAMISKLSLQVSQYSFFGI